MRLDFASGKPTGCRQALLHVAVGVNDQLTKFFEFIASKANTTPLRAISSELGRRDFTFVLLLSTSLAPGINPAFDDVGTDEHNCCGSWWRCLPPPCKPASGLCHRRQSFPHFRPDAKELSQSWRILAQILTRRTRRMVSSRRATLHTR